MSQLEYFLCTSKTLQAGLQRGRPQRKAFHENFMRSCISTDIYMLYEKKNPNWTKINGNSNIALSVGFFPCLGIFYFKFEHWYVFHILFLLHNSDLHKISPHCTQPQGRISLTVPLMEAGIRKKGQESLKWLAFELYVRRLLRIPRKRKGKVLKSYKNVGPSK